MDLIFKIIIIMFINIIIIRIITNIINRYGINFVDFFQDLLKKIRG
ncbi:hypothetical protein SAMN05660706_11951 [Desulfoscipio geothermicus DSM 3669]|uniref:Uncharacterized protein n=1 Tax=Desulfoscipio geothermicus DSM 3669 TaxID=1121426 RepID=A0A1I6DWE2_9FIRM|nr:hypothetical protein SAMN05660706_11951 [Desulfoscipio geothermicus DSM 3669]